MAGLAVAEATLALTDHPHDLTPLMALGGLKKLTITGGADWLDLSSAGALMKDGTSKGTVAAVVAACL